MERRTSLLGILSQKPATAASPDMSQVRSVSIHSFGQRKVAELDTGFCTKFWK